MSNDEGWTLIEKKKKKKDQKKQSRTQDIGVYQNISQFQGQGDPRTDGRSFERNRPNDSITVFDEDELSDTEEDNEKNEENIILETPLVWHNFAFIGDLRCAINKILDTYSISECSEVEKLKNLGDRFYRGTWKWNDDDVFEQDMMKYSGRCGREFNFISVIPTFTRREYGRGAKVYFVHVRFNYYFLAEENSRIPYSINMLDYYGFLGERPTHDPISVESDDIKDNRTNFMHIMKIVEGRMKHDKFQDENDVDVPTFQKPPYYSSLSKDDFVKFKSSIFKCKLHLEDSYSGYGVILDEKELERKIYLHNRRNCFQAFNHDIVKIQVFQQVDAGRSKNQNTKVIDVWSGRVVSVVDSKVKPVNKIFLCKLQFGHANHMIPICDTIPVIMVDNKFAKSQVRLHHEDLIKGLGDVVGIRNLIQYEVSLEHCDSLADKSFVTLKNLDNNFQTTVKRIQYVDCYRCEFIFLVIYRKWLSDSQFPVGEVVGLYTPDASFGKTLPLIAVSCDLSVLSIEDEGELKNSITAIKVQTLKNRQIQTENTGNINRKVFCFRYKNQSFNEVAYSYEDLSEVSVKLGIHVVNVEKYVKQDDFLDKFARKQFFTFLLPIIETDREDSKPSYLFSDALTNEMFSINKHRDVDVLSFYFVVEKSSLLVTSYPDVFFEKIKLIEEFDAKIVDEIIASHSISYGYLSFVQRVCMKRRLERITSHCIPPSWFYPDFTLKVNVSTLIISSEMDVLANEFVVKLLGDYKIENFPVNVKGLIQHRNKLDDWIYEVKGKCCVKIFPTLKELMHSNVSTESGVKTIRFSSQYLDEISKNREINMVKCDMLFPDVSFYYNKLENIVDWNVIKSRSDSGDSEFTVSITRPLSCFNDLVLERLLIGRHTYSDDDMLEICTAYRDNKKILEKYLKICRGYEIKDRFENSSFTLDCVFENVTEDSIVFNHPLLRDVHHQNAIFLDCLGLNKVKPEDGVKIKWKTRSFIYGTRIPQDRIDSKMTLDDIYLYETVLWRPNLNSSEITESDKRKMNSVKSVSKYPIKLTSDSSDRMDTKIVLSMKLEKRQILRIQFNYNYNYGVMKVIPEMLIVNPHLRVCLCHRHDTFKYFIHPSNLSKINYLRYRNIYDYKEQFRILNRIEGIHQTIDQRTSYFIHDVDICWIGAKNPESMDDVYGVVILDHKWCRGRFIKLGHQNMKIEDPVYCFRKAVKKNKMEFIVCVQSFLAERNVYWIGHAQIADVSFVKEDGMKKLHLTLKLTHSNFPFKAKLGQMYSMEVMETPISARVMDRSLRIFEEDSIIEKIVMKKIPNWRQQDRVRINYEKEIQHFMPIPYRLNIAQLKALNIALNQTFSLIWGPPGTGKTMVGCIIAFAYVQLNKIEITDKKSTVLYCGPSNQSVNVVAEKLMKMFDNNCPKLLRIFSSNVMNVDFPYPGAMVNNETSKTPDNLKCITLHHIVRQTGKPYASTFVKFERYFEENFYRQDVTREEYAKKFYQYESTLKKAFKREIESGNYEIVLCTAVGSCKKLMESFEINQVIIDESGMCSEPETLCPLVKKILLKNIVFIGDHKQLRPIITSPAAVGKQLNLSLFERLYNPNKSYCTMLDIQYRMHPSISEFPSSHFYKHERARLVTALSESWTGIPSNFIADQTIYNGLQTIGLKKGYEKHIIKNNVNIADNLWKGVRKADFKCFTFHINFELLPVKEKILFVKVEGHELNQPVSGSAGNVKSKGNESEVIAVKMIYEYLITKMKDKKSASESILIITQYRLQENLIKKSIGDLLIKLDIPGTPRVSTVVKSQGSECDYVIFSTVRSLPHKKDIDIKPSPGWISKYLGFITDPNQFNVAITRAKKGLFIIGNSNLLSVNDNWKCLIRDLESRGCFAENIFDIIRK